VELILTSLGTFPRGLTVYPLPEREGEERKQKVGYVPFALSETGKIFFRELGERPADSSAYLLMTTSLPENGATSLSDTAIVPRGILFAHDLASRNFCFLDLSSVLLARWGREDADLWWNEAADFLFPWDADSESATGVKTVKIKRGFTHDRQLHMLSLEDEDIFSHNDPYSVDFQKVLGRNACLIKDKKVMEIGSGNGVNLLGALKLGAQSVLAVDKFVAYVLLSRWNVQYALDTNQLPRSVAGSVEVSWGAGFAQAPPADVYLFNAPAIRMIGDDTNVCQGSVCIYPADFVALFDELRHRLSVPGTWALWRILPDFEEGVFAGRPASPYFLQPSDETVRGVMRELFPDESDRFTSYGALVEFIRQDEKRRQEQCSEGGIPYLGENPLCQVIRSAMAREFIARHGLHWLSYRKYPDIFLLSVPSLHSRIRQP
jgi:hypothetical protein